MANGDRGTNISISFGTIAKALLAIIVLIVLYLLRDIVLILLVSIVIASAIDPIAKSLARYHFPRVLSVLLVYIIAFGLLAVALPFFIAPVIGDLAALAGALPARLGSLPSWVSSSTAFNVLGANFSDHINSSDLYHLFTQNLSSTGQGLLGTASLIFGGLLSFILIVVISFYLSVQENGLTGFLRVISPVASESYVIDLWRRSQRKIGFWAQGQILLGLIMGVLVFLGLTIFQVPYALVLALLAAVFELIPFFGPILAAVPAVLIAFGQSFSLGLIIIALYLILQQFENHLIYPLVVKKMVGVPPLVVILAMLVGGKLIGFLGLLLAVPLAVVVLELLNDWEQEKHLSKARNG